MRGSEIPAAFHQKMASDGVGGTCSARQTPVNARTIQPGTQLFTKPPPFRHDRPVAKIICCKGLSIGHRSNTNGANLALSWSANGRAGLGYTGSYSRGGLGFGGFMLEGLFQPTHLLVIFFVALLVFGPKKLPELGKGLGEGIRALKNGMKDDAKPEEKV